jgi:hypothetical protein
MWGHLFRLFILGQLKDLLLLHLAFLEAEGNYRRQLQWITYCDQLPAVELGNG